MAEQGGFPLDDGAGLRVVKARTLSQSKFDWSWFDGYDKLRVLTYSASIPAIVRMLDEFGFSEFECVFGSEATLRDVKYILAFQQVAVGDVRAAIMGLQDERHTHILSEVRAGRARFRVLRQSIAHAKLYLLEDSVTGHTRVIVGSANLSERAFSGFQPETLVSFDNDALAWEHYTQMYDGIRNAASDEIPLPEDRIVERDIELEEVPAIADGATNLVIDQVHAEELTVSVPVQVERIEKLVVALEPKISAVVPPFRSGKQQITPQIKREISRIKLVKSAEEADNRYLSINRSQGTAILNGDSFSLEFDDDLVRTDAQLMVEYFRNFENFEGDVDRLKRDYFILWSWMYFSPFMCDVRSLALIRGRDVIRYPSFAIVFGKSNCGKTSLVDTLMTSMLGRAHNVEKSNFTSARLRALQQGFKRHPVVFDDIGGRAFRTYGSDMIKDELLPPVAEYPGFVLSMNRQPKSFPDEIVKRSLMIYTTTALPQYDEELRQRMDDRIKAVSEGLSSQLYKRYLREMLAQLDLEPLPEDWLLLSSSTLARIISESTDASGEAWCAPVTWLDYANKRYDRIKDRLNGLLRPSAMANHEGETPNGWAIENDRIIVWEQRDAFGRRGFDWEDVPSTLVDEDASGGNRTVLHKAQLEEFLDRKIRRHRRKRWRWLGALGGR